MTHFESILLGISFILALLNTFYILHKARLGYIETELAKLKGEFLSAYQSKISDTESNVSMLIGKLRTLERSLIKPEPLVISQPVSSSAAVAQTATDPVVSPPAV